MAQLTRDGIGAPSVIARIGSDQPRPWLAGGLAKGEWWLTWTDADPGTPSRSPPASPAHAVSRREPALAA